MPPRSRWVCGWALAGRTRRQLDPERTDQDRRLRKWAGADAGSFRRQPWASASGRHGGQEGAASGRAQCPCWWFRTCLPGPRSHPWSLEPPLAAGRPVGTRGSQAPRLGHTHLQCLSPELGGLSSEGGTGGRAGSWAHRVTSAPRSPRGWRLSEAKLGGAAATPTCGLHTEARTLHLPLPALCLLDASQPVPGCRLRQSPVPRPPTGPQALCTHPPLEAAVRTPALGLLLSGGPQPLRSGGRSHSLRPVGS